MKVPGTMVVVPCTTTIYALKRVELIVKVEREVSTLR